MGTILEIVKEVLKASRERDALKKLEYDFLQRSPDMALIKQLMEKAVKTPLLHTKVGPLKDGSYVEMWMESPFEHAQQKIYRDGV